jgi:hypothetical protein
MGISAACAKGFFFRKHSDHKNKIKGSSRRGLFSPALSKAGKGWGSLI